MLHKGLQVETEFAVQVKNLLIFTDLTPLVIRMMFAVENVTLFQAQPSILVERPKDSVSLILYVPERAASVQLQRLCLMALAANTMTVNVQVVSVPVVIDNVQL